MAEGDLGGGGGRGEGQEVGIKFPCYVHHLCWENNDMCLILSVRSVRV